MRPHTSRKGVTTYSVLYRDQGKQRSVTLTDQSRAEELAQLMGMIGVEKALAVTFGEADDELDEPANAVPTLAKSRKSVRTINVAPELLAEIETELERAPGDLLFQSTVRTRVNIDVFRSTYWAPAVKNMVPRPRIHDLRHTCASLMIKAGVPLTTVQAHLGHESIKTTSDGYGHLDREAGQRAAAAIAAAFTESAGE